MCAAFYQLIDKIGDAAGKAEWQSYKKILSCEAELGELLFSENAHSCDAEACQSELSADSCESKS